MRHHVISDMSRLRSEICFVGGVVRQVAQSVVQQVVQQLVNSFSGAWLHVYNPILQSYFQ